MIKAIVIYTVGMNRWSRQDPLGGQCGMNGIMRPNKDSSGHSLEQFCPP